MDSPMWLQNLNMYPIEKVGQAKFISAIFRWEGINYWYHVTAMWNSISWSNHCICTSQNCTIACIRNIFILNWSALNQNPQAGAITPSCSRSRPQPEERQGTSRLFLCMWCLHFTSYSGFLQLSVWPIKSMCSNIIAWTGSMTLYNFVSIFQLTRILQVTSAWFFFTTPVEKYLVNNKGMGCFFAML